MLGYPIKSLKCFSISISDSFLKVLISAHESKDIKVLVEKLSLLILGSIVFSRAFTGVFVVVCLLSDAV